MTSTLTGDDAAIAQRRPLLHAEGDHFTLINIYHGFLQRKSFMPLFLSIVAMKYQ